MCRCLVMLIFILSTSINCNLSRFIEITESNFKNLEMMDQIILYFYEQNSSRCDAFEAAMHEVIDNSLSNVTITIGRINAEILQTIVFLYQVTDLPTIVGLRKLEIFFYYNEYTAKGFLKFVNAIFIEPLLRIVDKSELPNFYSINSSTVLGYFNNENSIPAESFKTACLLIDYINCSITSNEEIKSILNITDDDHITLIKHIDEKPQFIPFQGNYTSIKEIKEFIQINELPLLMEYDALTKSRISNHPIDLHLLIFVNKSSPDFRNIHKEITKASKLLYGKAIVILLDVETSPDIEHVLGLLNYFKSDIPTYGIIKTKDFEELKYPSNSHSITSENLLNLFEEVRNGKRGATFKSEILPPDWNTTNVFYLVRENYKNITKNTNLTVFVNFYSKSCTHSKNMTDIWEELGQYYSNMTGIVIAKINADLNEIEGFPIFSTPSIYLYRKKNKFPVLFSEERTLKNFIDFIESNEDLSVSGTGSQTGRQIKSQIESQKYNETTKDEL